MKCLTVNLLPKSKKKNFKKQSVILLALVTVSGCNLTPLKIDPCTVTPWNLNECYAQPINQPDKEPYYRNINAGDVVVTADEYAETQKSYREILKKCGDRCK